MKKYGKSSARQRGLNPIVFDFGLRANPSLLQLLEQSTSAAVLQLLRNILFQLHRVSRKSAHALGQFLRSHGAFVEHPAE